MINAIKTLLIALSAIPAVISQNDCLEAAYGSPLSCTEDEIHVVDAIIIQDVTNIVIHDDGCQYPGDTVDFTGDFHLTSSGRNRFDIGLWFRYVLAKRVFFCVSDFFRSLLTHSVSLFFSVALTVIRMAMDP